MILIAPVKAAAQDMWVTTSAINLRNDIRNNVWDRNTGYIITEDPNTST